MMATLQTNALTTLERTKEDLGILATNTEFDDLIINYINSASDQIELLTNRIFHEAGYSSRLTGKTTNYVILEQFPASLLTKVYHDNTWTFDAAKEITVDTEVRIDKEVFLVRRGKCNEFDDSPSSLKVEYTAGYATIPEGLQQACVEYVRYIYLSSTNKRMNTTSRSKYNEDTSFETNVPPIIEFMLEPWKRKNVIERALQLNGFDTSKKEKDDG